MPPYRSFVAHQAAKQALPGTASPLDCRRACATTVSSQPRSGCGDVSAASLRSASPSCPPSARAAHAAHAPCARSATRLRWQWEGLGFSN